MGVLTGLQVGGPEHLQGTVPVWVTPADATLENQVQPTAISFPDWQSSFVNRGITLEIDFPSRPSGVHSPISHASSACVFDTDSPQKHCPALTSPQKSLRFHHTITPLDGFSKRPKGQGEPSLWDIPGEGSCLPMLCANRPSFPTLKLGLFSAPGRRRGTLATRSKSLIPVKTISLAWAFFRCFSILPRGLPQPLLTHACSIPNCSQGPRLRAHRALARDAWHQPTSSWVRRRSCHIADMGFSQLGLQQLVVVADMVAP